MSGSDNITEKQILERLLRKVFSWEPDCYGRSVIEIDLKDGRIVQLIEKERNKVADLSKLR